MIKETRIGVGKITIPGKPEKVSLSRIHGDTDSGIRFEVMGDEKFLQGIPLGETAKNIVSKGGRAFLTENDQFMFVDPPRKARKKTSSK